jgi:hypothetical protein
MLLSDEEDRVWISLHFGQRTLIGAEDASVKPYQAYS